MPDAAAWASMHGQEVRLRVQGVLGGIKGRSHGQKGQDPGQDVAA